METRIYIASTKTLEDAETFAALYKTVPKYRQKKIDSYKEAKDKRLSLGVGLLLTRALKEAGIDENSLELYHQDNGRPCFKGHPEIHFSLSHSEERVMCSISELPIGCDVEFITKDTNEETANWTKMECYAKASDTNMMDLISGKKFFSKEYTFKEINKDDGYKYIVCAKQPVEDSMITWLERF